MAPAGRRWLPWLAATLLALLALLLAGGWWLSHLWTRAAPAGAATVEVVVPEGASLRLAARRLAAAGLVADARLFEGMARAFGGSGGIRFGTYAFPRRDGYGRILRHLQQGDVLTIRLTIPEGLPSVLVAERLNAAPRLTGEVAPPPEGSVLPETYVFPVGEGRAAALKTMERGMTATLDRLWSGRSADTAVHSKEEAVILASIVEKETALPAERRRIAGLYSNRLRRGMPLQADPTVIYPLTMGRPLGRRILQSELDADNGYNTYRMAGLPKGPITNPGRASLEAVLAPEKNDYLYMVADGSGGHRFAATYEEHQRNVRAWRSFRAERGL